MNIPIFPAPLKDYVWIEDSNVDEVVDLCIEGAVKGVAISPQRMDRPNGGRTLGYKSLDISFLERLESVEINILITDPDRYGHLEPLYSLQRLKNLAITKESSSFSATKLKSTHLAYLRAVKLNEKTLPLSDNKLTELTLLEFNGSYRDISHFPDYPNLKKITFNSGNILNLNGLEKYISLREFHGHNLETLKSISALALMQLQVVDFDHCQNIQDLNEISKCKTIVKLHLNYLGRLQSLRFLKPCNSIDMLAFAGTDIQDGDLSVLLEMPNLKRVGFLENSQYSHTPEQIREYLNSRLPS
jgi:hypothetical protein